MFTIAGENLEAEARKERSENSEPRLSALLCFIINGESAEEKKRGKERVSGSSVTQDGPLSSQKAAEQGIGLEERRAVNREDINIGGFGYVLG